MSDNNVSYYIKYGDMYYGGTTGNSFPAWVLKRTHAQIFSTEDRAETQISNLRYKDDIALSLVKVTTSWVEDIIDEYTS